MRKNIIIFFIYLSGVLGSYIIGKEVYIKANIKNGKKIIYSTEDRAVVITMSLISWGSFSIWSSVYILSDINIHLSKNEKANW